MIKNPMPLGTQVMILRQDVRDLKLALESAHNFITYTCDLNRYKNPNNTFCSQCGALSGITEKAREFLNKHPEGTVL